MKLLSILLLSLSFAGHAKAKPRVLFMVNQGFNAHEYYVPLKLFKAAGFVVSTATKDKILTNPDLRQMTEFPGVNGDLIFKEAEVSDYDAIVFAGGNGSWEDYFPNEDVHKLLSDFMNEGKTVALLCSSTGLLGVANNLSGDGKPLAEGRKVTGYFRVEGLLKVLGKVRYFPGIKDQPFVMVDGNLITGRDPLSAELFGKTVVEELTKK